LSRKKKKKKKTTKTKFKQNKQEFAGIFLKTNAFS